MGWFIKFFEWLWLRGIKNWWSKLRWSKESKEKTLPVPTITNTNMRQECQDLYRGFDWHMDGIDDLFDTYMPAPYAYNRAYECITDGKPQLNGDCDDFHSAVLNMLHENGYDVALITLATIPITQSHTMTAIKDVAEDGTVSYRVVNYTSIKGPYKNLQEFVDNYGTPVRYWCLQKYDFKKGKYYNIDKDTFE